MEGELTLTRRYDTDRSLTTPRPEERSSPVPDKMIFLQAASGISRLGVGTAFAYLAGMEHLPTEVVLPTKLGRNRATRMLYFGLGSICLVLLGFSFLPGIPTADMVVLSLFFFARSSPRFEAWLRSRPFVQRALARYEGGLTLGTKIQATVGITLSIGLSAGWLTDNRTLRSILGFVWLYAIWFVWSRPRKPTA